MLIQNPVNLLRRSFLRKYITVENRYLSQQKAPSQNFDTALNTPLKITVYQNYLFLTVNEKGRSQGEFKDIRNKHRCIEFLHSFFRKRTFGKDGQGEDKSFSKCRGKFLHGSYNLEVSQKIQKTFCHYLVYITGEFEKWCAFLDSLGDMVGMLAWVASLRVWRSCVGGVLARAAQIAYLRGWRG